MENSPSTVHTESTATKSNSISAIVGNTIRVWSSESSLMEVDAVSEAELKENGFRSTRRTKIVCTIGPASCQFEQLESLAVNGMNIARINMCHGAREWDRSVIKNARKLNDEKGYAVTIMMDTEGREIHMGDLGGASSVKDEMQDSRSNVRVSCIHGVCASGMFGGCSCMDLSPCQGKEDHGRLPICFQCHSFI